MQNGEKMDIQVLIRKLVSYGVQTGLVPEEDVIYTTNRLLELFELDELEERDNVTMREDELEEVLKGMLDYAYEKGILKENSVVYRDLFDTKIMGMLMPRPSEVIRHFHELYEQVSPEAATDYYYKLSRDSDYIRRYRICKDMKWVAPTKYGDLDITINLSKPEKDPKAIAAAKLAKQAGYPKCLLCRENEGYAGRVNHPARLKGEMAHLKEAILAGKDLRADEELAKHADWVDEFRPKYDAITAENIDGIVEKEIGLVFMQVLEDAGVYKRTEEGQKAFDRFIKCL